MVRPYGYHSFEPLSEIWLPIGEKLLLFADT